MQTVEPEIPSTDAEEAFDLWRRRIGLIAAPVAFVAVWLLATGLETPARRLGAIQSESPHRLAAHAYVRYLGDLSGGQAIRGVIARAYDLPEGRGTAFYDFGGDPAPAELRDRLRSGLDDYGDLVGASRAAEIVEEALEAFARHRALFDELRDAA